MFEVSVGSHAIDSERDLTIVFEGLTNLDFGSREVGMGFFNDKKNNIYFRFDVVVFSPFWKDEEKNKLYPNYYFYYLFLDLLVDEFLVGLTKNNSKLSRDEAECLIRSLFDEAFQAVLTTYLPRDPSAIYRLNYLQSAGIVKVPPDDAPRRWSINGPLPKYNVVNVTKVRDIFSFDFNNTVKML